MFLPIDCVKVSTDTSDHPYNSKLKDEHAVNQLIPQESVEVVEVCIKYQYNIYFYHMIYVDNSHFKHMAT